MPSLYERLRNGGPDSARSWLMAFGGFIVFFFINGSLRTHGLFFKKILDNYPDVNRGDASWTFTLPGTALIYAAPLAGFLSFHVSSRLTILLGISIASFGSIACYFDNNIIFLSVFFGLVRGTGNALATTLLPGLVNNNCEKTRTTAMGITVTGTSVGGLVLPLVVQHCLDNYGLKSTFLLSGVITFSGVIGSLIIIEGPGTDTSQTECEEHKKPQTSNYRNHKNETVELLKRGHSVGPEKFDTPNTAKELSVNSKIDHTLADSMKINYENYLRNEHTSAGHDELSKTEQYYEANPLLQESSRRSEKTSRFTKALGEVFKSRGFYLVATTNFASIFVSAVFTITIVDYAVDKGIAPELSVYILTVYACVEIVGRLLLSWIADKNFITQRLFLASAIFVNASGVLMLPFSRKIGELLFCSVLIGVAQGILASTTKVIFVEYICKENMYMAFACSKSIMGISSLATAPIIGFFRDNMGSYDQLFFVMAGLLCAMGGIWIIEDVQKRRQNKCS